MLPTLKTPALLNQYFDERGRNGEEERVIKTLLYSEQVIGNPEANTYARTSRIGSGHATTQWPFSPQL